MEKQIWENMTAMIQKTQDSDLEQLLNEIESLLKKEHLPKVLLISNSNGKGIVQKTKEMLYGIFDMAEVELPVWCGDDFEQCRPEEIADCDAVILFTNATMALPQQEKEWMKKTAASYFGGDRFSIALYHKELLNTKSDWQELREMIEGITGTIDKNITLLNDDREIAARIQSLIHGGEAVRDKRHRAVIRYGLGLLSEKIQLQLQLGNIDIENLRKNIEKVEKKRKDVELAGKITVENIIENFYTDMKNQIFDAIDRYNEEAFSSIYSGLSAAKDVKGTAGKIPLYLETVWKSFEEKICKKMEEEQAGIAGELEKQITADCGVIIGQLELSENFKGMLQREVTGSGEYLETDADDNGDRIQMLSKGMMIASIALAFVEPVWGISALIGSRVWKNYKENDVEAYRRKVLENLYGECNDIKQKIIVQMNGAILQTKESSKNNISRIYSEMIETLMQSIFHAIENIDRIQEHCTVLEEIMKEDIPKIQETLK